MGVVPTAPKISAKATTLDLLEGQKETRGPKGLIRFHGYTKTLQLSMLFMFTDPIITLGSY